MCGLRGPPAGRVRTVAGTAANSNEVTQAHARPHGKETDVFGDGGYQGVDNRDETQDIEVDWHLAMRPAKRRAPDKANPPGGFQNALGRVKARMHALIALRIARSLVALGITKRPSGHCAVRGKRQWRRASFT